MGYVTIIQFGLPAPLKKSMNSISITTLSLVDKLAPFESSRFAHNVMLESIPSVTENPGSTLIQMITSAGVGLPAARRKDQYNGWGKPA